ncbi:ATPase family AAA domain-containing protein 2B isoform X1 [Hemiscyllium ocellatum]|uniref:ATPase family AAA domain-containing protein 2B isoform X1 n=1 Tax=Hemiscyllium ocellatum TaxID=170820 RepID=UPI00296742F6|nr:ATPase family AAA domain-containing protein 2B isoform X1 [Hemiscyllium ocellatum]
MVRTRRNSVLDSELISGRISSRTRSSRSSAKHDDGKRQDAGNDEASLSDSQTEPPAKLRRRNADPVSSDLSTERSPHNSGPAEDWCSSTRQSRLTTRTGASMQNGHNSLVLRNPGSRRESQEDGDHSHMNGDSEVRRSGRARRNKFETLNQSLLFDQLVNSTAEAVLQEMDNITSNIRQNRRPGEVERLRMWTDTEFENMDMYSRVKRKRKPLRRNMYGMPIHVEEASEGEEEEEEEGSEVESQEEEEDGDEVEEAEENDRPYNLRQRKAVQRYQAPPIEPVHRRQRQSTLFDTLRSPARRSHIRRKKHAIHSSDTTSSSDEERFERRKSKSMARARNRCLPMNIRTEDLTSEILRERVKVGASLADVDPMHLDASVRFDSVGGLSHHIQALKEMVVFPLLYPEVFERFKIQPPRGCLFYGPPGTGKTLVARALANECSLGDKKVSFFMRKGADCLSKWVGESERQLRLLFDQAYLMRPSIIFFDEIDGLAPVRSSRQDQIHSSIVSTLLALMDGLDNRGEVVIIGATNRLDSIDPALRRPGRFDREFLFNLPDKKARKHIFQIHTRDWNPKLLQGFLDELAEKCVGYCGADIKSLCTEAALFALRRRYPQIYATSQKLQLDVSSIVISAQDFYLAMQNIVPASQRAVTSSGEALSHIIRPLLENVFRRILTALHKVFPHAEQTQNDNRDDATNHILEDYIPSDDEVEPAIFENNSTLGSPKKQPPAAKHKPFMHFSMSAHHQPTSHRPRLLLCGSKGSGQSSHLAPALLHSLEKFSVHRLDLPAVYSVSAKTPEESCAQVFREARRTVPSVIYVPHIKEWWDAVSDTVRATFLTLLQDIPPFSPILIVATSEAIYIELPDEVKCIFEINYGEVIDVPKPNEQERTKFFEDLILNQAAKPPPRKKKAALLALEVLPPALPPAPRQLSEEEIKRIEEQEENTFRELRLFLRDVTKRLATDKRFSIFSKPVDIEEVSDYLEVIIQPMDLSTMMMKIDNHKYETVKDFLVDINLICSNALEYNPDKVPGDRIIRHRACTLKDTAHAIVAAELDPEFNKLCEDIKESRRKRNLQSAAEQTSHNVETKRDVAQDSSRNLDASATNGECKHTIHIKRKPRRRSKWGRGIIRKARKVIHLKKEDGDLKNDEHDADQGEESELAENGELEVSTDYHENGELSLTNDESSCDIMDVAQVGNKLENGTLEKGSGDLKSTGKEDRAGYQLDGNNEFSKRKSNTAPGEQCVPNDACTPGKRLVPNECTWSDESLASAESESVQECLAGRTCTSGNPAPGNDLSASKHEPGKECEPTKESMTQLVPNSKLPTTEKDKKQLVEDSSHAVTGAAQAANATKCSQNEDVDLKSLGPEKDVLGRMKTSHSVHVEQKTVVHMEQVLEDSPEPVPPVILDHARLKHILQLATKTSNNFTVDQLEKLYSLLSQCIYRHRKEYDKTQLLEEMENLLKTFHTFP